MPPQQPGRLLDLGDDILNFGAHIRYQVSGIRKQASGRKNREQASANVYRVGFGANQPNFRGDS
jgi:hypothetical protein